MRIISVAYSEILEELEKILESVLVSEGSISTLKILITAEVSQGVCSVDSY